MEFCDGLFSVKPHIHISSIKKTDLIIIPSLNHEYKNCIKQNEALADWSVQQYKQGAEIACICTGAFLLASSSILNGINSSTH